MLKIRAVKYSIRHHDIAIFIDDIPTFKSKDQQYFTAKPLEMRIVEPDEMFRENEPLLSIESKSAQVLMDDLWECGLRPSEGVGSAGQLAAVQNHLKDFKTILFKKLNIIEGK